MYARFLHYVNVLLGVIPSIGHTVDDHVDSNNLATWFFGSAKYDKKFRPIKPIQRNRKSLQKQKVVIDRNLCTK